MNNPAPKLKMAVYWGAGCGGCCVSVLDVHEALFDVVAAADLVFWPIALDTKYRDVEAMPDGFLDLTLFNGAIRTAENEAIARLLRAKTKVLVAYGACAHMGGVPGLANMFTKSALLERVYVESESTANPDRVFPQERWMAGHGILELPELYEDVRRLADVVPVDYFLPGCPPQTERLVEVFMAVATHAELPPPGSVVGANEKTLCDDCPRTKTEEKLVKKFHRPYEVMDDGRTCFIEQGLVCMGPATRGGCGARCINGGAPCRGCYGPPSAASADPGAKMMSALAGMIDSDNPEEIQSIVNQIVDPAGTFYRYSMPAAMIRRACT